MPSGLRRQRRLVWSFKVVAKPQRALWKRITLRFPLFCVVNLTTKASGSKNVKGLLRAGLCFLKAHFIVTKRNKALLELAGHRRL